MTVFVCGDSFMAPDPAAAGRHFSELMGAHSLAKPGCGNIDICFQIEKAIQLEAQRVIVGTTDSARIELRMTDAVLRSIGFDNFRNGQYVSDTIPTFVGEEADLKNKYTMPAARRESVKRYFADVYDQDLKSLTDHWALGYWYNQLEQHGIEYQVLPRTFCIYQHAKQYPNEPYSFHTDFATQEQAAFLLLQH